MIDQSIPAPAHVGIAIVVASLAYGLFNRQIRLSPAQTAAPEKVIVAAGLATFLPLLTLVISPPNRNLVIGTEGIIEAITAGLLLATVGLALRFRLPLLALGAFLILLEELDYGMPLYGYPDPAVMQSYGLLPRRFNFHNAAGQGLWRVVPFVIMLLLSRPRVYALARRLALPNLHPQTWYALPVMFIGGFATWYWLGPRAVDESVELALVGVFLSGWAVCAPETRPEKLQRHG